MSRASARTSRADVVAAAGRLFAERGYHGASMRDLGRELGLLGSSLYSHIGSKEELLVEVVEQGAALFQEAIGRAAAAEGPARVRLRQAIQGHIDVVLDHLDQVRTFLNEARCLAEPHRRRVLDQRDRYERGFRAILAEGAGDGSFRSDLDPRLAAVFVLSILNAVERWYRPDGALDRAALVDEIERFLLDGLR